MERKIIEKPSNKLKEEMQDALPIIYNSLHPSLNFTATEICSEIKEAKRNLMELVCKNPDIVKIQRDKFNAVLKKFNDLNKKMHKITK